MLAGEVRSSLFAKELLPKNVQAHLSQCDPFIRIERYKAARSKENFNKSHNKQHAASIVFPTIASYCHAHYSDRE
jgi:hypothetical protein